MGFPSPAADYVESRLSLDEANRWIRLNARTFRDASTAEGEDKLWFQFNPNGWL